MTTWVAIAVAGSMGAVCRYVTDFLISSRVRSSAPWGTAVVNLSGSFAAGVLAGSVARYGLSGQFSAVAGGGFLGAYTTFSTFMYESNTLFEDGDRPAALLNLATALLGVAAAALGWGVVLLL